MADQLTFDADTHRYQLNGVSLPSVTQVIGYLNDFSQVPPETLERACHFGTAVHKATELYDLGTLDVDSLDPALVPYLDAWKKFLADTGFINEFVEEKVFSKKYGYAGTVDRIGILQRHRSIIDIKSMSSISNSHSISVQTAGYEQAFSEMWDENKQSFRRYALQLKGNGNYNLVPYNDMTDFNVFLSCLNIYKWSNRK